MLHPVSSAKSQVSRVSLEKKEDSAKVTASKVSALPKPSLSVHASLPGGPSLPLSEDVLYNISQTLSLYNLIKTMTTNWSIHPSIACLDLLVLDLFKHVEKVDQALHPTFKTTFAKDFSRDFFIARFSLIAERAFPDLRIKPKFAERGLKAEDKRFVRSRKDMILKFLDLTQGMQKCRNILAGPASKSSAKEKPHCSQKELAALDQTLEACTIRIKLSIKLLSTKEVVPSPIIFKPFETAPDLTCTDSPLGSLTELVSFISLGLSIAVNEKLLPTSCTFFHTLLKGLKHISSAQNKVMAVRVLKQELTADFVQLSIHEDKNKKNMERVQAGELTFKTFCEEEGGAVKEEGEATTLGVNHEDFAQWIIACHMQCSLMDEYANIALRFLDQQCMATISDEFVPIDLVVKRFSMNLEFLCKEVSPLKRAPSPSHPSPSDAIATFSLLSEVRSTDPLIPVALAKIQIPSMTLEQMRFFDQIQRKMQKDLRKLFVLIKKDAVALLTTLPIEVMRENTKLNYSALLPILKQLTPLLDLLDPFLNHLEILHQEHLKLIEQFLKMFDKSTLIKNSEEWVSVFREIFLQQTLDICRFTMLLTDLKALSVDHFNLDVIWTEDHLLPLQLVNYIRLGGIDEILDKYLTGRTSKSPQKDSILLRIASKALLKQLKDLRVVPTSQSKEKQTSSLKMDGKEHKQTPPKQLREISLKEKLA